MCNFVKILLYPPHFRLFSASNEKKRPKFPQFFRKLQALIHLGSIR